jgi:1,4-alpha-glucan branching enzyme
MSAKRSHAETAKSPLRRSALLTNRSDVQRLIAARHSDPHRILGVHPDRIGDEDGLVVRAFHPDANGVEMVAADGKVRALEAVGDGVFAAFLPGAEFPLRYILRFSFADGAAWEHADPYRFLPTLGDIDLHLFGEGTHRRLWDRFGARQLEIEGEPGVAFAVWAPNAQRVSVVGDFCRWDGRLFPMRSLGASGVFELFIPGIAADALYKYEIITSTGDVRLKTDPLARAMQRPPETASRIARSTWAWADDEWMSRRRDSDPRRMPLAIYEVHLGSWRRVPEEGDRPLTYRESVELLIDHVRRLGFTHIELLPIMEHPFDGSWGYQVTGYYAPTSRFGTPDDFRFFVDRCHQAGVGVILDWVPAHFPKDDFALRRFDGTPLYEHEDPRQGEHPDWGTLIFNYGRPEVRNFLIANALYWLDEFHIDGLRVDAVASMLYLDYSRKEGEWVPNRYGGRENLEAIDFFRTLNEVVRIEYPGCMTIAEESTSWPGVTQPTSQGGLGFTFKWNMGWMHDTLGYFSRDPIHRRYHQDTLTFAMLYEHSERFIMPLSHDEVVHGKGSLFNKMPGDTWQKLANLRLLLAYQYTRPGKVLLFMGTELAQEREWSHERSLDWHLADDPQRAALQHYMGDLGRLYRELPELWRKDPDPEGFAWIDCSDRDNSVVSYVRRDGARHVVVVLNFTPLPRENYRIGTPQAGVYATRLSSNDLRYGGSGPEALPEVHTEPVPFHGQEQSMRLRLPPLGALILTPK